MECNNKIILRINKVLRKGHGSVASRASLGNYDSPRTDRPTDRRMGSLLGYTSDNC